MTIGPIQAIVIGFPSNDLFEGRIAEELARLSDVGQIRIVDAVFVDARRRRSVTAERVRPRRRSASRVAGGGRCACRLGRRRRRGGGDRRGAGGSLDADAPGIAETIAEGLLDELPDGNSALVLAIEHMWAIPLRDAVRDAGGIVLGHRSLTPEDLIAFGMAVGDDVND